MRALLGCLLKLSMASVLYDPETYNFGENWNSFIHKLNCSSSSSSGPGDLQNALLISMMNLLNFLSPMGRFVDGWQVADGQVLKNLSFLDVGCGSGIHSAAAAVASASVVLSFDRQTDSLTSTRALQQRYGSQISKATRWDAYLGDILKKEDLDHRTDVVYSWGALHHTGDLWKALEHSCHLVKRPEEGGGAFMLALYAREMVRDPDYWVYIKRLYVSLDEINRGQMEREYGWWLLKEEVLQKHRNPFVLAFEAQFQRGMNFWTDVKDWLGGYPIEFSEASDVIRFVRERCGLVPARVQPSVVTEFLFVTDPRLFDAETESRRSKLVLDWHSELAERPQVVLKGPFVRLKLQHSRSRCYAAELPSEVPAVWELRFDVHEDGYQYGFGVESDLEAEDKRRTVDTLAKLFGDEDRNREQPTRAWQARFGFDGLTCDHPGRHFREVYWIEELPVVIFSSSDGSDPNDNGRIYSIFVEPGSEVPQEDRKPKHVIAADLDFSRY
ncbi:Methyltransf_25 domain-containing protein [Durusdinium trenchii]|uniref:Methyltransf_25 domain-containing protein n=1 Tax=Durusdinium trenchii TaxID=1381693 RepID=A0ABP0KBD2_9DINO